MTGEIIPEKTTFIQRQNRKAFELPDQHKAEVKDFGAEIGDVVELRTPLEGGHYALIRLEEP